MSQRLFSVSKVGLFLDSYIPSLEKRRGEDVKVLTLTLRVQPFDAKLATAIDDGMGDDSGVRAALFKLSNPEPKPHLTRVNFSLGCPRQQLIVFASPDTKAARIAFNQVKIAGTYARTQKDLNGYAFVFKASYGPVGATEQEYIHQWMLTQRFVTFEEAEPSMDFDEQDEEEDDDTALRDAVDTRPAPMWGDDQPSAEADENATAPPDQEEARTVPKRGAKKSRKKADPESERAHQVKAGKKKAHTQPRKRR